MDENKKKRGFAAMDPAKVRAISALGGKAAHALGTAHKWGSEEARVAGKKGGVAPHVRRGRGRFAPVAASTDAPSESTTPANATDTVAE